jgi:hypothetical protein
MFVAVGTDILITSFDGVTWERRHTTTTNDVWQSVCWSPELAMFCAVSNSGTAGVLITLPAVPTGPGNTLLMAPNQLALNYFTGNLGIGTTNALARAHVFVPNPTGDVFRANSSSATNSGLVVNTNGCVGVGTATATMPLHVFGRSVFQGNMGIGTAYANTTPPADGLIVSGSVGIGTTTLQVPFHVAGRTILQGSVGIATDTMPPTDGLLVRGSVGIGTTTLPTDVALMVAGQVRTTGPLQGTRLRVDDGSASEPTLTFTSDTNTGVFRPADDVLALATGGTERMRLNANGSVGIGTTSPLVRLHVWGRTLLTGNVAIGTTYTASDMPPENGVLVQGSVGVGTNPTEPLTVQGNVRFQTMNSTDEGTIFIGRQNTTDRAHTITTKITTQPQNCFMSFNLDNNSTTKNVLTLVSTGSVGIGITQPSSALDVQGTVRATTLEGNLLQSITFSGGLTASPATSFNNSSSVTVSLPDVVTPTTTGSSTTVPRITVDAKGRVTSLSNISIEIPGVGDASGSLGVGIQVPLAKLHVRAAAGEPAVQIDGNVNIQPQNFLATNTVSARIYTTNTFASASGSAFDVSNIKTASFQSLTHVRLQGWVSFSSTLTYTFRASVNRAGVRLWIGGRQILNTWPMTHNTTPVVSSPQTFTPNVWLWLEAEYSFSSGTPLFDLAYSLNGGAYQDFKSDSNLVLSKDRPNALLMLQGQVQATALAFPNNAISDATSIITSRTVPFGQDRSAERSELIVFHGNDGNNGAGEDSITLRAPAIRLQTFNNGVDTPTPILVNDGDSGANDRMYITPLGSVGIGTTMPQTRLQVNGRVDNEYKSFNNSALSVFGGATSPSTTGWDATVYVNTTNAYARNSGASVILGGRGFNHGGGQQHMPYVRVSGVQSDFTDAYHGDFVVETLNNGPFRESLRVRGANGHVGIGTTDPQARLHVWAENESDVATRVRGVVYVRSASESRFETGNTYIYINPNESGWKGGRIGVRDSANTGTVPPLALQPGGGSVGIGTTSPTALLTLYNESSDGSMSIDFNQTLSGYWNSKQVVGGLARGSADAAARILVGSEDKTNYENSFMAFHTCLDPKTDSTGGLGALEERMRINSAGRVGIGTTNPQTRLHVNGTVRTWSPDDYAGDLLQWAAKDNPSTYSAAWSAITQNSVVAYTFSMSNAGNAYNNVLTFDRGNVGIGTTTPQARMHVDGSLIARTTTAALMFNTADTEGWYQLGTFNGNNIQGSRLELKVLGGNGYGNNEKAHTGGVATIIATIGNNLTATVANIRGLWSSLGHEFITAVKFVQGANRFTYEIRANVKTFSTASMYATTTAGAAFTPATALTASTDPGVDSVTVCAAVPGGSSSGGKVINATFSAPFNTTVHQVRNYFAIAGEAAAAYVFRISLLVGTTNLTGAAFYVVPTQYNSTGGAWRACLPISATGFFDTNAFELQVNVNTTGAHSFRVARKAVGLSSTGDVVMNVAIEYHTGTAPTVTDNTGNAALVDSASYAFYDHALFTHRSGAVGIGTAAPKSRFHVFGSTTPAMTLTRSEGGEVDIGIANTSGEWSSTAAAGEAVIRSGNRLHLLQGSSTAMMSIDTSAVTVRGELRVGNSDSANFISFRGTTSDGAGNFNHTFIGERIYATPESSELLLFKGNDQGSDRIRLAAGTIAFETYTTATNGTFDAVGSSGNLSRRMTISNDGNIIVDQTSKLTFGSKTRQMIDLWSTSYGIGVQPNTLYFRTNADVRWYSGGSHDEVSGAGSGGTSMMHLSSTGLSLTGTLTASTDVVVSSDRRYKDNIQPLSGALDKVQALQGCSYELKSAPEPRRRHIGLIAQEVREVVPEVVTENKDGYLALSYGNMVALLVEAVKELKAEVDALRAEKTCRCAKC